MSQSQPHPSRINATLTLTLDRRTWNAVLSFLRIETDHCRGVHASGKFKYPFVAGLDNLDLFVMLDDVCYRIFELLRIGQGGPSHD